MSGKDNLKYLLDTNPIIMAINKGIKLPDNEYLISVITEMELLSFPKLDRDEESKIESLLINFEIIDLDYGVKRRAIHLRKKNNLKLPDSIIAATAIENNAILITSDKQLHKIHEDKSVEIYEFDK